MKNQDEDYAAKGLRALKRAARNAAKKALDNNLKIPIWKNGKVVHIVPEIDTQQTAAAGKE